MLQFGIMDIQNFGRNVKFTPRNYYEPRNENEVLGILESHKGGKVRATGSGHAWNPGIYSDDAFLDIKNLNQIKIFGNEKYVEVGGGTKLEDLIKAVTTAGFMIPAMGGIMKQSVAGLASTATHGTGKSSFSHYITELRIAGYDKETGVAKIFEYKEGDKLFAARTSLGCMGVIVSMKISLVERYWIKEDLVKKDSLDQVLSMEAEYPIQQFAVLPYSWSFLVFARKTIAFPEGTVITRSTIMRFVDLVTVEIMPHLGLLFILNLLKTNSIISYYKKLLPRFLMGVSVTNEDYIGLTLHTRHHFYFRHVEMEVFIPEESLGDAFGAIKEIIEYSAGTKEDLSSDLKEKLSQKGILEEILKIKNKYTLHYTLFFRKVFPDETLISMTSGNKPYYAIGFFTYFEESKRGGYYEFTRIMALALTKLYAARLHWGKYFPLSFEEIKDTYPELSKFKSICKEVDQNGVFQNDFTKRILGE